jgi:primosomal protein N'
MKMVTVIPFIKSLNKESLTYFSGKNVEIGDIVTVLVRSKEVKALVVETEDATNKKIDIKNAGFGFKKIKSIVGRAPFEKDFLDSIKEVAEYFVCSSGQILNKFLPNIFFENFGELKLREIKEKEKLNKNIQNEKLAFQAPIEDRLVIYKTFIRESFAKKESLVFFFSTKEEALFFYENLKKGIDEYSVFLKTDLSNKKFIESHNKLTQSDHPIVLFTTPAFLYLINQNFKTYIIEGEKSNSYKTIDKPQIDGRIIIENLASKTNSRLILSDSILRVETLHRVKSLEIGEWRPLNWRLPEKKPEVIVDMRKEKNKDFLILSKKVLVKIKESVENKQKIMLFTLRKGYATNTVCRDCGTSLSEDGEPLILFHDKISGKRYFKTAKTNKKIEANIKCKNCGGWDLAPLGVGTEKVYEEVRRFFKKEKVFLIDKTNLKSAKKIKTEIQNFEKESSGILICTEAALPFINESIDNICIVSFDSLFNIPTYNVYEKIVNLLVLLNSLTKENILVQTRYAEEKILEDIRNRNLIGFYKDEIENREKFKYPPFFTLIKVSYESNEKERKEVVEYLSKTYEEYSPILNEMRIRNNYSKITMLLKLDRKDWDFTKINKLDKKLLEKLKILPAYWNIQINPEQVL